MESRRPPATNLVLTGAGHAHLAVLRAFAARPVPGLRLTLIAEAAEMPHRARLMGWLHGAQPHAAAHADIAPLAAAAGARLIRAEPAGLDLAARRVLVAGRPPVPFDLLSLDLEGSSAPPGATEPGLWPLAGFATRLEAMEAHLLPGARIGIAGADVAGTELALALARRFAGHFELTLIAEGTGAIPAAPPAAQRVIAAALADAGVAVAAGVRAIAFAEGRLALSDGTFLALDEVIWATPPRAPAWLAESGLATAEDGSVRTDAMLRSVSHPFVLAARPGMPLAASLRAAATGRTPRRARPRPALLTRLDLADGRAAVWAGQMAVAGIWVARLADRLTGAPDTKRAVPPVHPARAGSLARALAGHAEPPRADIALGLFAKADAPVAVPPAGFAIVQAGTRLRLALDDPYLRGEIAASHGLGPILAMGAQPWTALATAGAPEEADLPDTLRGLTRVLTAEGVALIGCTPDTDTALGLTMTGLLRADEAWRHDALQDGDALVLIKPLGTALILRAHAGGNARTVWLDAALAAMRRTNTAAARILRAHGAAACTCIADDGFAAHLERMLRASSLDATFDPAHLPLLPGARELADPETVMAWPEIAGGLLAGIAAERADSCLAALAGAGYAAAVVARVIRA